MWGPLPLSLAWAVSVLAVCSLLVDVEAARVTASASSKALVLAGGSPKLETAGLCNRATGCRPVKDAVECTELMAKMLESKQIETDEHIASRNSWKDALAGAAKWAASLTSTMKPEWFIATISDACTVESHAAPDQDSCTTLPHGCAYTPGWSTKRVWWNQYEPSPMTGTVGTQLLCVCGEAEEPKTTYKSISGCGAVKMKLSEFDVLEAITPTSQTTGMDVRSTQVTLQCSMGSSFSGLAGGAKQAVMSCSGAATASFRITGEPDQLEEVPQCLLNKCEYRPLFGVAHEYGQQGLWKAEATDSLKELESSKVSVVHGHHVTGAAVCLPGHTTDGALPTPKNTVLDLQCYDGMWIASIGVNAATVRSDVNGGAIGFSCKPIKCPDTAAILEEGSRATISGARGFIDEVVALQPLTVECEQGFVLCAGAEESATCPEDKQVKFYQAKCTVDGAWLGLDKWDKVELASLSCKPVQCAALTLGENNDAYDPLPETFESSPALYTYTPDGAQQDLNIVIVTCAEDHTLDGSGNGATSVALVCSPMGEMMEKSGAEWDALPQGPICRPKGCAPVPIAARKGATKVEDEGAHGEDSQEDESVAHMSIVELNCGPLESYTGYGRYSWTKGDMSMSNFQRKLQCQKGQYKCIEGWCNHETEPTAVHHALNCMPVRCAVPTEDDLQTGWNLEPLEGVFSMNPQGLKLYDASEVTVPFACLPGFQVQGSVEVQYRSKCTTDWGTKKRFSGWEPALLPCDLKLDYCPELAVEENIDELDPKQKEERSLGSMVAVTCTKGFTYSNIGDDRPTMQLVECLRNGPAGGTWGRHTACEAVKCLNPPMFNLAGRSGGSRLAGETLSYTCQTGYRWAFVDGPAEHAEALPPTAPAVLVATCTALGHFEVERSAERPKCVPVQCASPEEEVWAAMVSTSEMDQHVTNALHEVYTWQETEMNDWAGRAFDAGNVMLQCAGGNEYPVACGNDGTFRVGFAAAPDSHTWPTLKASTAQLLADCGSQLRVEAPQRKVPTSDHVCLTLDGSNVAIKPCVLGEADSSQSWRFDEAGAACEKWGKIDSANTAVHEWQFCGKVRSMRVAEGQDMQCLLPPVADNADAPMVGSCDDAAVWTLNAQSHTMRMVPMELRKSGTFRGRVYITADTSKEGVWAAHMGGYFNDLTESGITYARPELSAFPNVPAVDGDSVSA